MKSIAFMTSKKFTTIIIFFNLIVTILLFTTSELILLRLLGYKVVSVGASVQYEYSINPSGTPIPTALPFSIPNYPLMLLFIMLIANMVFYYRLRKQTNTLQN
jgi:NADH:ubiquinone oxidoreductase subunit 3 (subunit A)